jgi:hypothetical protein
MSNKPNKHGNKVLPNIIMGIFLISVGTILIVYDVKSQLPESNKYLIGAGIVIMINAGLYFWGLAFVHKIKSDLIKRQRSSSRERESVQEL